ncbi:ATP-utilizing chromatin assembly and remodelling N-terminal-domain-containing protein [Xylaria bambusicola]|uniref:ATP-utilizing chromatin assembly and remodelling N-terminal-domain-containing protein n=1 Tax=Xylaria bambusicola TaxID=326684 RepID=UPI0020073E91|nr:ATP-utilizing chromatin assembly and remodelling N-terminal-domain-containing protein [Xylaria bambusicola]KAI0512779.1 ATP-utilizing chromatin assembly and remodelling N-terminal-domain-containing protein [Xylaria bambusicola]
MVLFKRKPVQFIQPPQMNDESTEVWHVPQTGEVFSTYEEYLGRIDFYSQVCAHRRLQYLPFPSLWCITWVGHILTKIQPRFICQITGHSGLTFFEALKSELAGAQEVDQAFPEALKGPVLRRVQFQTISRIDTLVDMIYEEFKADYYPGEAVTIQLVTGERLTGTVRDKARLGSKVLPDGTLTQPYSRYSTSIDGRPDEEAVVDSEHIFRDRKIFTKSVLRSFIKKTVTREAWNGAPWLVKHDVAAQYHIDTRVPPHLRYDNKLLERKQQQAQKRALQPINGSHDVNGTNGAFHSVGPTRLPELKPAPKPHKIQRAQQHEHPGAQVRHSPNIFLDHDHGPLPPVPGDQPFHFPVPFRQSAPPPVAFPQPEPPPPPPPPPKYPIEDLQLPPRDDYVRPPLKFLCGDPPEGVVDSGAQNEKIQMKSVGPLLETWDTLNVYCEIFKLDSFTFDDFIQGLEVFNNDTQCELFTEIHCAVLKQIVSSEADGGKLLVNLPELDDEEEEEDEDESTLPTPEPEPEPKPAGRATRSSLAKLEAERLRAEAEAAEREKTPEVTVKHRAPEVLADFNWIEELKQRNFSHGGWEMIIVGLLHQLSKNPRQTEACEELLAELVPPDEEPSVELVRDQYSDLDFNLRISILQILCMLTMETKAVRGYMDDCAETMTGYRKEKIEWQRNRKQALEDLKVLHEQRKILLPENMPPSPTPDSANAAKTNGDVKMTGNYDSPDDPSEDGNDSDDDGRARRHLRRGGDRAAERQRKREELERKREAELAAKVPKQSKQFVKLLKDIRKKEDYIKTCEDEIAVIDNDLREADCGRTRVLGKDRFWNRYYWFERNGMPYAGLPNSSTAHAGYANGSIWVQGPDDMEREGYIDMPAQLQDEYKAKFKMTVPERKKLEEGRTSVFNARQWGYYSEPSQLDSLLNWLDPRGFNELKLRKELLLYKDKIVANMENRTQYISSQEGEGNEKEPEKKEESKRMSTRTKAQANSEPIHFRCLDWTNTMATEELGHLHSEPPPPPKPRKGGRRSRG